MASKPKLRVFLDSNVLFSALYSPGGSPGRILDRSIDGDLTIVVSGDVLDEVVQTFKEKFPFGLGILAGYLTIRPPEIAEAPTAEEIESWRDIIHAEDAVILASAVAAKPHYFVTGDKHFFESPDIARKSGLRILTPSQFLKALDDETGSL